MDATNATWRPPYPSENLKTPRLQQNQNQNQNQQQLFKTFSTTNPYAIQPTQPTQPTQSTNEQQEQSHSNQFHELNLDQQHSKRENNSNKIYERGLTPQVGMNPFLQGNYLQDLETQNQFLKPMNSNISNITFNASDVIPKNV